ncbi:MAG: M56 family metallopeptidase, partial [Lachnospiraceae bacterium]|nr:M56 family metallopeptidase [Lachnospiraceae bacterium]
MLILAMSLSGSVVFLAILLCAVLGKKVVSSAWVYNMLKLNLLFFCLPLPKYNSEYKYRLFHVLGILGQWNVADISMENFIGIEESGRFYLNFQTYIIVIWGVWACGLLFVCIRNRYTYQKVKALKVKPRVSQSDYLSIFDRIKEEVGIKQNITLLCANDVETICTLGVFQKYVIIPEEGLTEEEIYYSLKHELIHVKRSDVAWRYIGLLAVLIHWFNPLAYLYFYVMSVYCEQSCDAILVQNLDKAARKRYGQLIIYMAQEDGLGKRKYQTYLSEGKKVIEWRLINMLKSGKRNRIEKVASLLLGVIILFGGSLTVCAYENPRVVRDADAAMFETLREEQGVWGVSIEEIRFSEEEVLDFVKFLGDDGRSYNLSDLQSG